MPNAYDTAKKLMRLGNRTWDDMGLDCRPEGETYQAYIATTLDKLNENFTPADITEEVYEILEDENYHTLTDAIDIFCDPAKAERTRSS